ncbi:MAG: flippase-like domain-containing protein [Bacteroidia bacterium]|nr:flippase-like domain-containing protein [Bacteroidia bacterium]
MQTSDDELIKKFEPRRIILPLIIAIAVAVVIIYSGFDAEAYRRIELTSSVVFWIIIAVIMMVIRDLAYMYRLRVLTDDVISWRRSFVVIMLWEFASAISPGIVGGAAFAFFLINNEKVKMGKSVAVVLTTSFLDELFFVLMAPLIFFVVGKHLLFDTLGGDSAIVTYEKGFYYGFWVGYGIICAYIVVVSYAIFVNPRAVKYVMVKVATLPLIRKFRQAAAETGDDLIIASKELRKQNFSYWFKSFMATVFSWTARYMVVNCLIMAFITLSLADNFMVYARQLVMWILLLVSPTPGGAGIAEVVFPQFLKEFIPIGLAAPLGVMWRLISWYPYLIIGALLLPRWLRKYLAQKKESSKIRAEKEG